MAKKKPAAKKPAAKAKAKKPAARKVTPIPPGYHSLTPHLVVRDAAAAMAFYAKAFGAKEKVRMPMPDGKIMHAEMKIGDSFFFLVDEMPNMGNRSPESLGGSASQLHIYVRNADDAFAQALAAGATVVMPLGDQFWGDRFGMVKDPFGHTWSIGSRKEIVTPKKMTERMKQMFSGG